MTVESYVQSLGRSYKKIQSTRGTEINMNCPFCGDTENKFFINAESGAYNCFHKNKCPNQAGSFWEFQKSTGSDPQPTDKSIKFKTQKREYTKPSNSEVQPITTPVLDWLHQRLISDETLSKLKIREGKSGWVAFPYFKDGILLNLKQRNITTKKFTNTPGKEPSLYNRDNIKPDGLGLWELTIVEGEMDCLAMDTYGIPTVSIPDGANSNNWIDLEWEWLEKFAKINLCLDMDDAGTTGKISLNQRLGEERCYEVRLPYKDANECLLKGVSAEEIGKCIDNAKQFPIDGIKEATEYLDEMLYMIDHPELSQGIETPFVHLTKIIKGFRMSELTILAGDNHSGKTTYMGQIITYLARKRHSSCIASLEMPPAKTLKWMVDQTRNQWETEKETTISFMKEIGTHIAFLDILKAITPEVLFTAWRLAAKRYGTKFFVLDSLTLVNLPGGSKWDEQGKFLTDLMAFVHEWKCHVFVISHVRKPSMDRATFGKSDVKGSGEITNLAHNVIMFQRLDGDEIKEAEKGVENDGHKMNNVPAAKVTIKKCREVGQVGSHFLKFDVETKSFSDILYY